MGRSVGGAPGRARKVRRCLRRADTSFGGWRRVHPEVGPWVLDKQTLALANHTREGTATSQEEAVYVCMYAYNREASVLYYTLERNVIYIEGDHLVSTLSLVRILYCCCSAAVSYADIYMRESGRV